MDKNNSKTKSTVLLLIVILILLYLLIQNFGYIENKTLLVPTGNVDIFEIDCNCCTSSDKPVFKESTKKNSDINKSELEEDEEILELIDLTILDDYKIWDNKELHIFSNPAYEYQDIIAPGSFNSYAFVIRNDNDFDVMVDIRFIESNDKNINMKYKLKNSGNYLIGTEDNYVTIKNKKVSQVFIAANSQEAYILDWKWVDSLNDAMVGFDVNSIYKLSIIIGVN